MVKQIGILLLCTGVLVLLLALVPSCGLAAGTSGVSRSVANNGSGYDVTIRINDTLPDVVGIVETLPNGSTFAGSSLPADQCQVSGSKVAFAVINETEFTYTVSGASPADAAGQWTDLLGDVQGTVGQAGTTSPGSSSGSATSTPGFGALIALASLGGIVCLARRR